MRLRSFFEWILLSVCLHLILVGAVLIYNTNFEDQRPPEVAIELIDDDNSQLPRVRPREQTHNQIVEQKETKEKTPPPDTRFLSAQNQKVEKETVAKNKGEFKNSLSERKKAGQKEKITLQDLTPKLDPFAIKEKQQSDVKGQNGTASTGDELSQTTDYIKDVATGDQTSLNTREFRYYTYYSRIRKQLSHHWEPKVREKMSRLFRQGRRIASDKDHVTKLLIFLNNKGQLVKVQVVGASGVYDLDDAAMEAFRSAAPFPNPPAGIVESDGYVKIRWDFVLES